MAEGHEGVMAKHQASRYLPGQRSPSWRKIKPSLHHGLRTLSECRAHRKTVSMQMVFSSTHSQDQIVTRIFLGAAGLRRLQKHPKTGCF
jgi:ATP-dependent DNA ligase